MINHKQNLSLYAARAEDDQTISWNVSLDIPVDITCWYLLASKREASRAEWDCLSIYPTTEGSALPLLGECWARTDLFALAIISILCSQCYFHGGVKRRRSPPVGRWLTVGDTIPSHAGHPCPYTTCHASCATIMGVVVGCTQCSHRSLRHLKL